MQMLDDQCSSSYLCKVQALFWDFWYASSFMHVSRPNKIYPPYQIPKFVLPQHFPSLSSQQAPAPFYFRWAITSFTAVRISWIVCLGSLAPKMAVPATRTLEPAHKDQSCAPNLIKPAILPLPIYPFSGVRVFLAIYKKNKNKK